MKNKNLRLLGNVPLLAHSIGHAKATGLFHEIAVSSDCDEILDVARKHGASIALKRPDDLAGDLAPKVPAILHALNAVEAQTGLLFDTLVDLDATSPLREAADVVGATALLEAERVSSVITGSSAHRSPYFNLVELTADGFVRLSKPDAGNFARRQDVPKCFDMNASVYVWNCEIFRVDPRVFYGDSMLFEMPEERSRDIDSELDLEIVRFLFDRAQGAQGRDNG